MDDFKKIVKIYRSLSFILAFLCAGFELLIAFVTPETREYLSKPWWVFRWIILSNIINVSILIVQVILLIKF